MTSLPLGLALMLLIACAASVHYARAADRLHRRVESRERVIAAKRAEIARYDLVVEKMAREIVELEMLVGLRETDARLRHPAFRIVDGGA